MRKQGMQGGYQEWQRPESGFSEQQTLSYPRISEVRQMFDDRHGIGLAPTPYFHTDDGITGTYSKVLRETCGYKYTVITKTGTILRNF